MTIVGSPLGGGRDEENPDLRTLYFAAPPGADAAESRYKRSPFNDPSKWSVRYGPVLGVGCLVFWVVVLIVSCVSPFIENETRDIVLLIILILSGLISIVCLCLTNLTDPGTIIAKSSLSNAAYLMPVEKIRRANLANEPVEKGLLKEIDTVTMLPSNIERIVVLRNKRRIKQKWCVTCKIWRPPQASHCRICDKCIYRFDHHCGVVGNCVAFANHRFFASFLFLCVIAWICGFILGVSRLAEVKMFTEPKEGFSHPEVYPILLFLLLSICNFPCVFSFSLFHLSMVFTNSTTYEKIQSRQAAFGSGTSPPVSSPGCWASFVSVWKACFAPVRWRDPWLPIFGNGSESSNVSSSTSSAASVEEPTPGGPPSNSLHGKNVAYLSEKDTAEQAELRVLVAEEKFKNSTDNPPGDTPPPQPVSHDDQGTQVTPNATSD